MFPAKLGALSSSLTKETTHTHQLAAFLPHFCRPFFQQQAKLIRRSLLLNLRPNSSSALCDDYRAEISKWPFLLRETSCAHHRSCR